jgi:hypothetical protein
MGVICGTRNDYSSVAAMYTPGFLCGLYFSIRYFLCSVVKIEYSEDCVHYQQLQHPKVGVNLEVREVGLHQWVLVNTRG